MYLKHSSTGMSYKTGEKIPTSGLYRFVKHVDEPKDAMHPEPLITLSKGETFPLCNSCNKAAFWRLERYNELDV
jgi:hypothetical protein